MNKKSFFTILMNFTFFSLSSFANNNSELLKNSMELSRNGKWNEAIEILEKVINNHESNINEKCEAIYGISSANLKLENFDLSNKYLKKFDNECKTIKETWLINEVKKLKNEFELKDNNINEFFYDIKNDKSWEIEEPKKLGINEKGIKEHDVLCKESGADSCLVIYKGKIIFEKYYDSFSLPVYAMSSTKSITAIVLGILKDEKKFASIDEPVYKYIPEWNKQNKRKVAIKNLLTHTSGLENKLTSNHGVGSSNDKDTFVKSMELDYEPNKKFSYSNEGVQLLSPIMDKIAGEPIQDYAKKKLFDALELKKTKFHLDKYNHAWTYADLETTPREFAKLGLLMMNNGKYENKQIVSEEWIRELITPNNSLKNHGLLWWLYDKNIYGLNGYGTRGYLNTSMYIFPEKQLIVIRTQSKAKKNISKDYEPYAFWYFNRFFK